MTVVTRARQSVIDYFDESGIGYGTVDVLQ